MVLAVGVAVAVVRVHRRASAPPPESLLPDLTLVRVAEGARVSSVSGLARARVFSVVDGDTLRVSWNGREERLRYYGVDTPEKGEACCEEASRRNAALAGDEVLLAFDERPRDKYGRILAYVFTPEGLSIDAALVAEGFGRAWTRDGRWRDAMEELEEGAREADRGCLWSSGRSARRKGSGRRGKK